MTIKKEYALRYDPDGIYIIQKMADGTERELSPISDTAAMVWDGLEHGVSRERILESVTQEFDGADPAVVAQDYEVLLTQLTELGYLEAD